MRKSYQDSSIRFVISFLHLFSLASDKELENDWIICHFCLFFPSGFGSQFLCLFVSTHHPFFLSPYCKSKPTVLCSTVHFRRTRAPDRKDSHQFCAVLGAYRRGGGGSHGAERAHPAADSVPYDGDARPGARPRQGLLRTVPSHARRGARWYCGARPRLHRHGVY